MAKIIITLLYSPAKMVLSQLFLYFCCSVSVENISVHFQTFILPLIVIIQWDFICTRSLTTASAPYRDLISPSSSLSEMTWRNRTNWDRLNPEELWQRPQDALRNLTAKLPEKLYAKLCVALAVVLVQTNLNGLQLMAKWMFGNVHWYFLLTHNSKI